MKPLKSLIAALFISLILISGGFNIASAQETNVDSYELFWPLVAGKTLGEPLYFLKTFKENIREIIIVGNAQKADYNVLLATKRILEAEKLINQGKINEAKKSLETAKIRIDKAEKGIVISKSSGELDVVSQNLNNQLTNIATFTDWLSGKNNETRDLLLNINEKASSLLTKI
jgi:hypothetical protein